jgi:hypothetical protein
MLGARRASVTIAMKDDIFPSRLIVKDKVTPPTPAPPIPSSCRPPSLLLELQRIKFCRAALHILSSHCVQSKEMNPFTHIGSDVVKKAAKKQRTVRESFRRALNLVSAAPAHASHASHTAPAHSCIR